MNALRPGTARAFTRLWFVVAIVAGLLVVGAGVTWWLNRPGPQVGAAASNEVAPEPEVPATTAVPAESQKAEAIPMASPTPPKAPIVGMPKPGAPAPPPTDAVGAPRATPPARYYRRLPGRGRPSPAPVSTATPTPSPTAVIDEELNRLEKGSLAFNAPPKMTVRRTERVQLLIQPGAAPEALAGKVTAPGPIVTGSVAISKVMEAMLSGGPAFDIDASGAPRAQPVSASEPTQWNWLVTPLEPGQHDLHLTVNAVVTVEGIARSRVLATKDYTIEVQVAPAPPAGLRGTQMGWLWLLAIPAAAGAYWFWRRTKRSSELHRLASALRPEGAQAFISYSRQDSAAVVDLVSELHARGLAIWLDTRNIEGGEMWASAISTAIRDAGIVILMASPASIGSAFVRKEIALATAHAKPVLPVMVQPCELPDEWELAAAGVQRIDTAHCSKAEAVSEILRALSHRGIVPVKTAQAGKA